eukprot:scaffold5048_cov83-Skeletonema_marinoi.AAC.5
MSESDNSDQAAKVLLSMKLAEFCQSDSLSEEGLREIIEHHELKTNNHDVGDYEFFREACYNKRVNKGIIQCLLEYFPAAASATDYLGQTPLHFALCNKNITVNIIQLLIDAAPVTVRSADEDGVMPLHRLCDNKHIDEASALEILELLKEKCPEAVRHATNNNGDLPIHIASGCSKSVQFCRVLIEAYPGSERITASNGMLPFHCACAENTRAAVEYVYKLYPDAINLATTDEDGYYPIHYAIMCAEHRDNPIAAVGVVKYLLESDPNVKFQEVAGEPAPFVSVLPSNSLLHFACGQEYNDSNIDAALEMIKIIYDAYPDPIDHWRFVADIRRYHQQIQTFINSQRVYVSQADDHRQMMTPDDNGRLPLHSALQNNVRLGSIKLLVKGNPSAIRTVDTNFALPLHVACQHHESTSVVQYLLGLDMRTLRAVDYGNNTALHYACRGAKYDTIAMLLEKYGAVSVSKQNAHGKLPIDLLWESSAVEDRDGIEYTESIFLLLRTYPEMVVNCNGNRKQPADADANQNGKKRKLDAV